VLDVTTFAINSASVMCHAVKRGRDHMLGIAAVQPGSSGFELPCKQEILFS